MASKGEKLPLSTCCVGLFQNKLNQNITSHSSVEPLRAQHFPGSRTKPSRGFFSFTHFHDLSASFELQEESIPPSVGVCWSQHRGTVTELFPPKLNRIDDHQGEGGLAGFGTDPYSQFTYEIRPQRPVAPAAVWHPWTPWRTSIEGTVKDSTPPTSSKKLLEAIASRSEAIATSNKDEKSLLLLLITNGEHIKNTHTHTL